MPGHRSAIGGERANFRPPGHRHRQKRPAAPSGGPARRTEVISLFMYRLGFFDLHHRHVEAELAREALDFVFHRVVCRP